MPHSPVTVSAPRRAIATLASISARSRPSPAASTASGPSGRAAAARRTPRARLTAVGRARSSRDTAAARAAGSPANWRAATRDAQRPGDPDRGRPAHGQPDDRVDHLIHRGQTQSSLDRRAAPSGR